MPVLALNRPELAVLRLCNKIDSLISVREFELFQNRLWDFTVQPDILELACVLRLDLQIRSDKFFEQVALLFR